MSQNLKALPQTFQASQNWTFIQVPLGRRDNCFLSPVCQFYLSFTSEGLPGKIHISAVLSRSLMKLNWVKMKKKKKTQKKKSKYFSNSQLHKTVFQLEFNYKPFHADKVILCRSAGKARLLQDKPEWEDHFRVSSAKSAYETPFNSDTHTKHPIFHRLHENHFLSLLEDGGVPVWVQIQAILKAYFIASQPCVSHAVTGSRKQAWTTQQSWCSPLQTIFKGCVTHFNTSHADVQARFGYFSHALAQLHIPAPI